MHTRVNSQKPPVGAQMQEKWEIVCKAPAKVIIAGEYLVLFGNVCTILI
jgi:hypothetical protein